MAEAQARILLWGIEGAGKSTTLRTIHARLRPESRGELVRTPSRLDPTVHSESLSIALGDLGGKPMQIEVVAVPGAEDQAMTRKQLLDQVDGVILVLDCSPARIDANAASIEELKRSLAAYGQRLDALPVVFQYNKRDVADPFAIEALHRRIGLKEAAVFETIATSGHGVLPTLTTISKHVVRLRRDGGRDGGRDAGRDAGRDGGRDGGRDAGRDGAREGGRPAPPAAAGAASAPSAPRPHEILEAGILAEADSLAGGDPLEHGFETDRTTQPDWSSVQQELEKAESPLGDSLRIVSVGRAAVDAEGALRLPLVLGDDQGRTRSLVLSLRLDSALADGAG